MAVNVTSREAVYKITETRGECSGSFRFVVYRWFTRHYDNGKAVEQLYTNNTGKEETVTFTEPVSDKYFHESETIRVDFDLGETPVLVELNGELQERQ